jgi:hypothetical protein
MQPRSRDRREDRREEVEPRRAQRTQRKNERNAKRFESVCLLLAVPPCFSVTQSINFFAACEDFQGYEGAPRAPRSRCRGINSTAKPRRREDRREEEENQCFSHGPDGQTRTRIEPGNPLHGSWVTALLVRVCPSGPWLSILFLLRVCLRVIVASRSLSFGPVGRVEALVVGRRPRCDLCGSTFLLENLREPRRNGRLVSRRRQDWQRGYNSFA